MQSVASRRLFIIIIHHACIAHNYHIQREVSMRFKNEKIPRDSKVKMGQVSKQTKLTQ